ncbi:MAG TPA: helix-turn-helix transcriptional regulator [Mycobacteriales bacterium]|nr:helix-turn-helix transcriptional regulator [Mycobacteriales bacterium]
MDGIGARVRMVRNARKLGIRVAAGLAGVSKSAWAAWETGDQPLNRLSEIEKVAEVLGVSKQWLQGSPAEPTSHESAEVHRYSNRIREAMISLELGEHPGVDPRPLTALVDQAYRASGIGIGAGELSTAAARLLPDILVELHAWVAAGTEQEQVEALRALVLTYATTCSVIKWAGSFDLAWIAASAGRQAAVRLGEPMWCGLAEFYVSHALAPYARALTNSESAIAALQPHVGADPLSHQVYGMLHQMAAFGAAVTGQSDVVQAHLAEAGVLADKLGDNTDLDLYFGPTNLSLWRAAIAVEQGEGGRASEVARHTDIRRIPSPARQASFLIDVGRGFVQERHDSQALTTFLHAEALAPQIVTNSALVRSATEHILTRATRAAGGADLREFARRVGAVP